MDEAVSPRRLLRPKDAATLIIYRRHQGVLQVLMGERHADHVFMPNRYVFPGGRLDRADFRVRVARPLRPQVAARLCRAAEPARAQALALAAVRETFEETGLVIGEPDPEPGRPVPVIWRDFFATGAAPALDRLDYVVRAVTPPGRPRRFNARFFLVDAEATQGVVKSSGELLALNWISREEALGLTLARITEIVLERLPDLIARPEAADRPVPLFLARHGRQVMDEE